MEYPLDRKPAVFIGTPADATNLYGKAAKHRQSTVGNGPTHRLAVAVARMCYEQNDVRNIAEWARVTGTNRTSLIELCRRCRVRPRDCRDFMRVLRALSAAGGRIDQVEVTLDVGDFRTLRKMLSRAGLVGCELGQTIALGDFLDRQS